MEVAGTNRSTYFFLQGMVLNARLDLSRLLILTCPLSANEWITSDGRS